MRITGLLFFFLICLLSCSSFNKSSNKSLLAKNKQKASDYNREYYQKNREKLKLRARERYRRNRKL
ncbi:hypothetical protein [Borreliella burgdorferi]|uniref:hypothetical protein n=1 Tax=Borreliella burgdorferi TaxID=139 RepID=UPI001E4654F7|nr:hypothetical protein [Borreliella burgdorferi]MCD2402564.1 hypothetical protein [Borreliella burgdorferi]MCD2403442.1 hypothetical protein [Borreliella burgdorferi]MCD2404490.1 hypothetical protein [Borreliella burgdorferi]MCD2414771.1 hypothetical protein [Borreliella burgdorferi]